MGACLSDTSAVTAVSPKSVSSDASAEEAEAADIDRALLALERDQKELDYIGRLTNLGTPVVQRLREAFVAHAGSTDSNDVNLDSKKFATALGLPHNTLTQRMFAAFNVTKSKKMNFREFAMAAALLSSRAPKEDKIRFSFDLYDLNGDKLIDRGELKEMLQAILTDAPLRLSDAEIDAVCVNTFRQSAAALANLPASQSLASKSKPQTRSSKSSGKHVAEGEVMEFEAYRALVLTVPRLLNAFSVDLDALLVTRSNFTMDAQTLRMQRPLAATRPAHSRTPSNAPLSSPAAQSKFAGLTINVTPTSPFGVSDSMTPMSPLPPPAVTTPSALGPIVEEAHILSDRDVMLSPDTKLLLSPANLRRARASSSASTPSPRKSTSSPYAASMSPKKPELPNVVPE